MEQRKEKPLDLMLLMAAMLFQGFSGVAGGIGLVMDPTGETLGIPQVWLHGSPFDDYTIPGWILLLVLGIMPLVVLFGVWKRHVWSWWGSLAIGIGLLIWIGVEISVIGYQPNPPLQAIYGVLGVVILVLTLLPGSRRTLLH